MKFENNCAPATEEKKEKETVSAADAKKWVRRHLFLPNIQIPRVFFINVMQYPYPQQE